MRKRIGACLSKQVGSRSHACLSVEIARRQTCSSTSGLRVEPNLLPDGMGAANPVAFCAQARETVLNDMSLRGGMQPARAPYASSMQGTPMPSSLRCLLMSFALVTTLASAQEAAVLRDLDAQGWTTLTRDELSQLLPDARMSRVNAKGNRHFWTNDAGGDFVISSDNRDKGGRSSTAQGKWHISEDGRYCVLIEWKAVPTEEWCRYIVKSGTDYYATKSDKTGTEKVYGLSITR